MATHRLRVLHVSDLHVVDPAKDPFRERRERVLGEAWDANLDAIAGDGPIDLVCFTGDLAFSGKKAEYERLTAFVDALLAQLGVPRSRFFVVPGNHDVDRKVAPEAVSALRDLDDEEKLSAWMLGGAAPEGAKAAHRDAVSKRQGAYRHWVKSTLNRPALLPDRSAPHPTLGFRETIRVRDLPFDIHVLGLDSAWLAHDDGDSRKLRLTRDQVLRLSTGPEGARLGGFRLALIHHPFTDLADGGSSRGLLAERVDLLLRGHLHERGLPFWTGDDHGMRELSAGNLHGGEEWPIGCQVVDVSLDDDGHPTGYDLWFRGWSTQDGGRWIDDSGHYQGTTKGRVSWVEPPRPIDSDRRGVEARDLALQGEARIALRARFALSLDLLAKACGEHGEAWMRAFATLGHAPAGGVGKSLGAATAGLPESDFDDLMNRAAELFLATRGATPRQAWRLHPLLGELLRERAGEHPAWMRGMTAWFQERLPELATERNEEQGKRWREVGEESDALVSWLEQVPLDDALKVARDMTFAIQNGPFSPWLSFCERVLASTEDLDVKSVALWTLSNVARSVGLGERALSAARSMAQLEKDRGNDGRLANAHGAIADIFQARGDLDEALRIRRDEELPVYERLGDVPNRAITMGKIADIFNVRGDLDEALRIHRDDVLPLQERLDDLRNATITRQKIADIFKVRGDLDEALRAYREMLPVHERLGDVRSRAVVMGRIADVFAARGDLDEALRIRRDEELPVFERLGEARERAITMGKIGDIHRARGDLDEALRICREEQVPVYERLGDLRLRAVAMGKISDILQVRGELDEALRIRRDEELPVYERLGDVRSRAVVMGKIGDLFRARGDLDEALRMYGEAVPVHERLGDVRERAVTMGQMAGIFQMRGSFDEALRVYGETLPVYERLGDVGSHAITRGNMASIHVTRGELDEALRIFRETLPVYERLGDVQSRAFTVGQMASIFQARGELDEALRVRRDEQLPVYERLGDVQNRAITMTAIGDIYQARGDLDEALRIFREAIPVYERLGDVRSRATTLSKIGDILAIRGELDEALRIYQEEVIPVDERVGDRRMLAVNRTYLAQYLIARNQPRDRADAAELFRLAIRDADAMGIPDAEQLRTMQREYGLS